jgi:two-component system NtrC family sensor kinase
MRQKSIRFKIYAATISLLVLAVLTTSLINIARMRTLYGKALQEQGRAAARDLREGLYRNLEFFPLEGFGGMTSYLKKTVSLYKGFSYCYIADRYRKILYHSDASFIGKRLDPRIYSHLMFDSVDEGTSRRVGKYYETILPLIRNAEVIGTIHVGTKKEFIDGVVAGVVAENVMVLAVALLVCIFLLYFLLTKSVIRPIARLAKETSLVSSRFHLEHKAGAPGDELEQFAKSFEVMIDELGKKTVSIDYVQNILESMTDALLVVNSGGIVERANKAASVLLECVVQELPGRSLQSFLVDAQELFQGKNIFQLIQENKLRSQETYVKTLQAKVVPVLLSCSMMEDRRGDEKENIVCTFKDITARKQVEEKLKEIQRQQQAILNNIPDIAWLKDKESRFIAVNEPFGKACGLSPETLVGKTDLDIWPGALAVRYRADDREVMLSGRRKCVEEPLADKEGKIQWIETIKTPIYNDKNEIIGTTGIARDITDRKKIQGELEKKNRELAEVNKNLELKEKALENILLDLQRAHKELKNAQGQLVQSEKLASIGQLAAGMAHEINNPVGFIASNLSILRKYIKHISKVLQSYDVLKSAARRKDAKKVEEALIAVGGIEKELDLKYILTDVDTLLNDSEQGADRIRKLVNDLRTFSRRGEDSRAPADLNEVLDGILNIVWNEIKYKAELHKEYGKIPSVSCNAQQMGQVFMNVLINAVQAIKEKGVITIRTYADEKNVCVEISDTGKGIHPEILSKIFDPFYTTKKVGEGTGLGLSISYELVKKHNGDIAVKSEAGKGTTFIVSLPINKGKKVNEIGKL